MRKVYIPIALLLGWILAFFVWGAASNPAKMFEIKSAWQTAWNSDNVLVDSWGPDCKVRFEYNVSPGLERNRANRLLDFLRKNSPCNDGMLQMALVRKTGETYEFLFPIKQGSEMDENAVRAFHTIASELSAHVFDSQPVKVHMCDEFFKTLRVVEIYLSISSGGN